MKKTHIGIQPYAFQCAGAVVGQQAVGKGQHGVDPVKRRAAVSPVEKEIHFPAQQQMVKYAEVGRRSYTLQPPQSLQIGDFQRKRKQLFDLPGSVLQAEVFHPRRVIAQGALNAGYTVAELSENHVPGNRAAFPL